MCTRPTALMTPSLMNGCMLLPALWHRQPETGLARMSMTGMSTKQVRPNLGLTWQSCRLAVVCRWAILPSVGLLNMAKLLSVYTLVSPLCMSPVFCLGKCFMQVLYTAVRPACHAGNSIKLIVCCTCIPVSTSTEPVGRELQQHSNINKAAKELQKHSKINEATKELEKQSKIKQSSKALGSMSGGVSAHGTRPVDRYVPKCRKVVCELQHQAGGV